MRSLSTGLMGAIVCVAVAASADEAHARGGGVGVGGGARAGSGLAHRGVGIGGRAASVGRRLGPGNRFGRADGYGRGRFGYGYLGWAYGGYGPASGYGSPFAGSFGAYDQAPPTSIGIPASPVAPPAIYVLRGASRMKASTTVRGRQASRTLTAQSSDAAGESGVVTSGPRIIRVVR